MKDIYLFVINIFNKKKESHILVQILSPSSLTPAFHLEGTAYEFLNLLKRKHQQMLRALFLKGTHHPSSRKKEVVRIVQESSFKKLIRGGT